VGEDQILFLQKQEEKKKCNRKQWLYHEKRIDNAVVVFIARGRERERERDCVIG
jgi:hypothetical protein